MILSKRVDRGRGRGKGDKTREAKLHGLGSIKGDETGGGGALYNSFKQ